MNRHQEMRAQAIVFHKAHPKVWILFVEFTLERIAKGFNHYSARGIFHRIRWETAEADTSKNEFKINDNHSPFYSRRFMRMYPQHDGFFRTRHQISKESNAVKRPALGPHDF